MPGRPGAPAPLAPPGDPITGFRELFARAAESPGFDPTEMTLATVGDEGHPAARIVLLKGVADEGFDFFTNYESRKGRELAARPFAALVWRWPWIDRQVRAEGVVERLPSADSDAYFASRPRGSQIGAWASAQSRPIASYEELEAQVAEVERRFEGVTVPRPPHWGGFRLRPLAIEFWHGRPNRLHERHLFRRATVTDGIWTMERLSP
ncbi:MAG: pyridoxamine 5'-phosphate oxidase [Thermoanaerobaculia bacterium]